MPTYECHARGQNFTVEATSFRGAAMRAAVRRWKLPGKLTLSRVSACEEVGLVQPADMETFAVHHVLFDCTPGFLGRVCVILP